MDKDKVIFAGESLSQLMYWIHNDIKIVDKIYTLIKDIKRNGAANGIGKPERLKYEQGWSRRINQEHRLVYRIENEFIIIKSCKGHYED